MSASDPREALEFLQALLVGQETYDRVDPDHVLRLSAACRGLETLARLLEVAPGLEPALAALAPKKKKKGGDADAPSEREQLQARRALLEELARSLEARAREATLRVDELEEEEAVEAVASLGPESGWDWVRAAEDELDGVVAIDLGTTNVVCARWNFQAEEPGVSTIEPVAVNVLDAMGFDRLKVGSYLVGERALGHRRQVNLYRSFRRFLGTQQRTRPAITGSTITQVAVSDLAAAVVLELLRRLAQQTGSGKPVRVPRVVVTVPAGADLAFEYELRRALDALGVEGTAELDEATAAGIYHLLRPLLSRRSSDGDGDVGDGDVGDDDGEGEPTLAARYAAQLGATFDDEAGATLNALCVDVGGGTTDLSLIQLSVDQDRSACRVHIEVVDTAGFPDLSGEGLTLHLFKLLKRRLALALADPGRALGVAGAAAPAQHPWLALHRAEAGPAAEAVPVWLQDDVRLLLASWDAVRSTDPLPDDLRLAVDRMVPTASEGAAKQGQRARKALFQWLWDQAEVLKRRLTAQREHELSSDGGSGASARLELGSFPRPAGAPDLAGLLGPAQASASDPSALGLSAADVDAHVEAAGLPRLEAEVRRLVGERTVDRVILAGNGARDVRFSVEPFLRELLGLSAEQVDHRPDEAKVAVAKGACLWAVGNRLEGVGVTIARHPRHPHTLELVSIVSREVLFLQGQPINRFAFAQPPAREGAEGDRLIQVDRVVGQKLEPFLMFDPRKGEPLLDVIDSPLRERADLVLPDVDQFLEATTSDAVTDFQCKDPASYFQLEAEWVSEWEMLERLRVAMSMEEAVAWIESSARCQQEPPTGHAYHRYYMDETRELYLVFHADGKKLLCRSEVTEQARRALPPERDPFSGVH